MSKRAKIILIVVVLVVLITISYFLLKPKSQDITQSDSIIGGGSGSTTNYKPDAFPFDVGSAGENVRHLQIALNRIGGDKQKITEDGIFGPNTKIKLLTTVNTTLSQTPVTEAALRQIIAMGNRA